MYRIKHNYRRNKHAYKQRIEQVESMFFYKIAAVYRNSGSAKTNQNAHRQNQTNYPHKYLLDTCKPTFAAFITTAEAFST